MGRWKSVHSRYLILGMTVLIIDLQHELRSETVTRKLRSHSSILDFSDHNFHASYD